ncbi:MAG TPA: hypothetical protein VFU22_03135 [Roseiflexaceae bacterium]|nr:hypothetical protein [Roseiflexaceae bacterium]
MKTWHKVLLITLITAVPAFILAPMLWRPDPHGDTPVGLQLLLFMVLAGLDALTFGLGVAFICYGLPLIRRVTDESRARTWITFIATAWLLISWWPHDNMHKHNGMNLNGLLVIDYVFHVSMMVAGVILAYNLVRALQSTRMTGQTSNQYIAARRLATRGEEPR